MIHHENGNVYYKGSKCSSVGMAELYEKWDKDWAEKNAKQQAEAFGTFEKLFKEGVHRYRSFVIGLLEFPLMIICGLHIIPLITDGKLYPSFWAFFFPIFLLFINAEQIKKYGPSIDYYLVLLPLKLLVFAASIGAIVGIFLYAGFLLYVKYIA